MLPGRTFKARRVVRRYACILFVLYVIGIAVACSTAKAALGKHDRDVIRFFQHHPKLAATPQGGAALAKLLPKVVREIDAVPVFPPHHNLWMCEHNHEASDWHNRDTGGNGHYGGLQMHPGYGYGTSYYASDDSQITQEWAAEKAFAASGYSTAWLLGQWYHPDCLVYA